MFKRKSYAKQTSVHFKIIFTEMTKWFTWKRWFAFEMTWWYLKNTFFLICNQQRTSSVLACSTSFKGKKNSSWNKIEIFANIEPSHFAMWMFSVEKSRFKFWCIFASFEFVEKFVECVCIWHIQNYALHHNELVPINNNPVGKAVRVIFIRWHYVNCGHDPNESHNYVFATAA